MMNWHMNEHRRVSIPTEEPAGGFSDTAFLRIRDILCARRNFDIASYKDKYIKRRISIRIRATRTATVDDYCDLLQRSEEELDLLVKGLTIHVSQFFRNRSTFEKLGTEVFPALFARLRAEGREHLTLWSAGCAGGEEPFTLALILAERFAKELEEFKVSIVATDIDDGILEAAQRGIYGHERLQEAPAHLLNSHFCRNGDKYCLSPAIRGMVEFRRGDLFDTGNHVESDLILCRNVLIYFERREQERILLGLSNALTQGGILILGKAETLVGELRRRFGTICPVERIYTKNRFSVY